MEKNYIFLNIQGILIREFDMQVTDLALKSIWFHDRILLLNGQLEIHFEDKFVFLYLILTLYLIPTFFSNLKK
jgi:hypothetical protein